jgi:hypothetical protein
MSSSILSRSPHDAAPGVAKDVELAVRVGEVERGRGRGPGRSAADLGEFELDPVRKVVRTRCGSPVTGLRIGRPVDSRTPGITTRAVRASMSHANSIGLNSVECTRSDMAWKTHQWVFASSVSPPLRTVSSAFRCAVSARSSMITCISPLPS